MIDFAHRLLLLEPDGSRSEFVRDSIQSMPRSSPILWSVPTTEEAAEHCRRERPDCVLISSQIGSAAIEQFLVGLEALDFSAPIPTILLRDRDESHLVLQPWMHQVDDDLVWESLTGEALCRAVRNAIRIVGLQYRLIEQNRQLEMLEGESDSGDPARSDAVDDSCATTIEDVEQLEQPKSDVEPLTSENPVGTEERPEASAKPRELTAPEAAELIHERLMPKGAPFLPGFDIARMSQPALGTGGDFYEYLPESNERTQIAVGDCTGRGILSAMLMTLTRAYLRSCQSESTSPDSMLGEVNRLLAADCDDADFVALMLVEIDARHRSLRYSSAGMQGYILRRNDSVDILKSTAMPLGIHSSTVAPMGPRYSLDHGDVLILATDGISKTVSPEGESFGSQRLLETVAENRDLPARLIANIINQRCIEFAGNLPLCDDFTTVLVRVTN